MPNSKIVAISGPSGSGKTTLARTLSKECGWLAVIRDEIKQGLVPPTRSPPDDVHHDLDVLVLNTFRDVVSTLAHSGVSFIAEAAFQDELWRYCLEPLQGSSDIRIIHCRTPTADRRQRLLDRLDRDPHRRAHDDQALIAQLSRAEVPFAPTTLGDRVLRVDTTTGWTPDLMTIARFALS